MRFEWDEDKNRRNRTKHKVSFEIAQLIFGDPYALSQIDRVVHGEERWQTLGCVGDIVVLRWRTGIERAARTRSFGSSRHAKPLATNGGSMKKLSRQQADEIAALKGTKNDELDTSDLPEVRDWNRAVVGKFYRPIKKSVTIRVDTDVLAWLKSQGAGYQTRINALLRRAMETDEAR